MARQVLPIVGAVVGAYFGNPQLGYAIGSIIGNAVDPEVIQGPKIGDAGVQTSSEGVPRPIVFGIAPVVGNVIMRGNRIIRKVEEGGKGGPVTESERVSWTFAIRIAEPISAVSRIWEEEKLVYDVRPESTMLAESMEYAQKFRLYLGGEDQLPDPDLEVIKGAGNVSAYRGTAYIVFPNFDLTDYRERIPTYRFEVNGATVSQEVDQVYAGYNYTVDYPGAGGFVFNPTTGVAFPLAIQTAPNSSGGTVLQIFDDYPGYVKDEYEYRIFRKVGDDYIDTGVFRTGGGFIGFNRDEGEDYYLIPTVAVLTPNTKMRFDFYTYTETIEELISQSGETPGFNGTLGSIVSALHGRVKQQASKFDVSELTDNVYGVVFAGDYTVADGIRSLLTPYMSDASEYDDGAGWKIHYIKRGKAVVKVLTEDDLVDEPERAMRESAIEFPAKLHMFFQNPLIGYAPAKSTSVRSSPDVRVIGEASVQVPVVLDDVDAAAQMANKLHKIAWAEAAGDVVLTVSDEHLDLVASDNVGLSLRGTVRRLRITKVEDNPGTRKLTFRVDRQSAYTSNVTGVPLPPPTPPPPSIVGQTVFEFLDIPALLDTDDILNYYDAAGGTTEAWFGASVQRQDSIGDFFEVNRFSRGSAIGVLLADVANASEHYTDTTNALQVQFYLDPALDSLTDAQFLSEAGALAVEKPDGTWELMQYRDAEQDSEGNYTLTTLHRGRLNSGTSEHMIGGRVVVLTTVQRVSAVTSMIDTTLTHRAVSFGTSPETAVEHTDTYTAKSQTEWPVANLLLDRAADEIAATAVPRHRFGTEDNPVRSINWMGYRWTATDGTNTVARDTTTDSTTFDATGLASPVTVTVAQINRYTGAGPIVSEDIA